jgi:hypothetical protein
MPSGGGAGQWGIVTQGDRARPTSIIMMISQTRMITTRCTLDEIGDYLSRMTWLEWMAAAVLGGYFFGVQFSVLLGLVLSLFGR